MGKAERQQRRLAEGWGAIERNDPRAAEQIADSALRKNPRDIDFVQLLAASYYQQGRYQEAIAPLKKVFQELGPKGVSYNLGFCYLATGDPNSAEKVLEQGVKAFPDLVESRNLLGVALTRQGRNEEALGVFASAIERHPRHAGTLNNIGNTLSEMNRHSEAVPYLERAAEIEPGSPHAHYNLGNAYRALGRHDEAIERISRSLRISPNDFDAHNALGAVYRDQGRYEQAIGSLQKALAINPDFSDAHHNLALALDYLNCSEEAVRSFEKALAISPNPGTYVGLGNIYQKQHRLEEAVSCYRQAISLQPGLASAHLNLGLALQDMKRLEEAVACFEKTLAVKPDHATAVSALAWARAISCDWGGRGERVDAVRKLVREGPSIVDPFAFLAMSQEPDEQKLCAERYLADALPKKLPKLQHSKEVRHGKIRVAYLSADFRDHPVSHCVSELFRLHDRAKFELFGVSFGADDGSEMSARLRATFDQFLDVRGMSDSGTAGTIRDLGIDIAVDLMGYTKGCRPRILAHRPAPIQVSYLGYPGTTGADFIDYMLADRFVIPEGDRRHYSEHVVYLPESYMANHSRRVLAEPVTGREAFDLPQTAFVFCCFNNGYKITPEVFDAWMRLLQKIEGSVLWLSFDNSAAEANLRREAADRGVDRGRLVFARRLRNIEEHYARYRLADLFLDTAYNGHVTVSDALWAGLPVLTCTGRSFAGRVAGGMLNVLGLPELVTADLAEYEALALSLAADPQRLGELRERLGRARKTAALFDADRFRRHIEAAYTTMWEIRRNGERPRSFAVSPVS
jgi:protein O-GlcNAc transferase